MLNLPSEFSADFPGSAVWDQKNTPACVAHSTAYQLQHIWYNKTGEVLSFSPRFLHILSMTKEMSPDDGREITAVWEIARRYGCCTENLLPNDTSLPNEEYCDKSIITQEMLDEAAQYRVPEYRFVSIRDFLNKHNRKPQLIRIFEWLMNKKVYLEKRHPMFRGTVGRMSGYQFQVYSDDHGEHFHVLNKERGINARFSFPEMELIDYKLQRKNISSKDIVDIKKYFSKPENFKKLETEFSKRNILRK